MSRGLVPGMQGATFGRLLGWSWVNEIEVLINGIAYARPMHHSSRGIYPHWHIPHIWLVFMVHVVQIGFRFNFCDLRSDWFDFDMKVLSVSGCNRTIYQNVMRWDFQPFPANGGHCWPPLEWSNGEKESRFTRTLRPFGVRFLGCQKKWPKMSESDREQTKSRTRRTSSYTKGLPEMAPNTTDPHLYGSLE